MIGPLGAHDDPDPQGDERQLEQEHGGAVQHAGQAGVVVVTAAGRGCPRGIDSRVRVPAGRDRGGNASRG